MILYGSLWDEIALTKKYVYSILKAHIISTSLINALFIRGD